MRAARHGKVYIYCEVAMLTFDFSQLAAVRILLKGSSDVHSVDKVYLSTFPILLQNYWHCRKATRLEIMLRRTRRQLTLPQYIKIYLFRGSKKIKQMGTNFRFIWLLLVYINIDIYKYMYFFSGRSSERKRGPACKKDYSAKSKIVRRELQDCKCECRCFWASIYINIEIQPFWVNLIYCMVAQSWKNQDQHGAQVRYGLQEFYVLKIRVLVLHVWILKFIKQPPSN